MQESAQTVAVVDLGSTSFHMVVAQVRDDRWTVLDRLREMVQLAEGLDEDNCLTVAMQRKALDCLSRFGERLRDLPRECVRIVGTNTLRRASNAADFIAAAQLALNHPIDVISGVEEARLIYLGVAQSLPEAQIRCLALDIGGGSTELIVGERMTPLYMESLYMGCVSMTKQFFADGVVRKKQFERALLAAHLELQPVKARFAQLGWSMAVGASGTVRTVEKIALGFDGCREGVITYDAIQKVYEMLLTAGNLQELKFKNVRAERINVLPGGLAILMAIFEALNLRELKISESALREGLLYDQVGRIHHEDVRDSSILQTIERYQIDKGQARRVEQSGLNCLAQVADAWRLTHERYAQFLTWAARLHEIGLAVAHDHYHKHGAYLAEHADLPGFSRQDQRVVAALIGGHRRKFPLTVFKALGSNAELTQRLCILLRLAVLLHRSRTDEKVPDCKLIADDRGLHIQFPSGWLGQHPLTQEDLHQEAHYLKITKIKLTFE